MKITNDFAEVLQLVSNNGTLFNQSGGYIKMCDRWESLVIGIMIGSSYQEKNIKDLIKKIK